MPHQWECDPIYVQFQRLRDMPCCGPARRIQKGLAAVAKKGFWIGGSPPYGLRRLLLGEQETPLHLLAPGQRKGNRKHRVMLVLGDATEVAAVRRIFREFVELGYSTARIADGLNIKRLPPPRGIRWTAREVLACLRNKRYTAPIAYRRKKSTSRGAVDEWVRTNGVDGVIGVEQFRRAQELLT